MTIDKFHISLVALFFITVGISENASAAPVITSLESLEFVVLTNLKAIKVRGMAKEASIKIDLQDNRVTDVETIIPVENLETGMALRDRHMREKIFQTKDGKTPPILFSAKKLHCKPGPCSIHGLLRIRGEERRLVLNCQISKSLAACKTVIKLSDFGIERPSQLGVKVADEVAVTLKVKKE